ncbi:symmetrical bis(5'-nucleosyl)-tetraphosphatase [Candidatus Pandoraea novymonadis]|uniref:Bis(5'-nucleosyl)-tetraphosphatase, symmetrical n=1 Tax=Candidatus Pandoraea novymonadis TaxID=1808959 RepID=A0ABX5FF66_9BURK|nr:symmetrical bis(5'-nucleosyl)-tetraphosphatase [Candidatus Pandoraea novymonadis]PSB92349.1 Bis(5'-nucleosyl)-tetraphosphatase, symmetrical [Candidatus Pandoraea novymonadis]
MTAFISKIRPIYAIGDLHGCLPALKQILARLPTNAELWFCGDLINRGPNSLGTLRHVMSLEQRSTVVLGNHDLYLLAIAAGIQPLNKTHIIDEILNAPDIDILIDWIRHRPIAHFANGYLMVHAGVLPQWSTTQTVLLAQEVEHALRSENWKVFLRRMFGNQPDQWQDNLKNDDRHRLTINALTRLRFCTVEGRMDFDHKTGPDTAIPNLMPWFDVPGRRTADTVVLFGHWSALGLLTRDNLIGLDTGCVWGGQLTAFKLTEKPSERNFLQVNCQKC